MRNATNHRPNTRRINRELNRDVPTKVAEALNWSWSTTDDTITATSNFINPTTYTNNIYTTESGIMEIAAPGYYIHMLNGLKVEGCVTADCFVDSTGSSPYLPLSGGSMSGTINQTEPYTNYSFNTLSATLSAQNDVPFINGSALSHSVIDKQQQMSFVISPGQNIIGEYNSTDLGNITGLIPGIEFNESYGIRHDFTPIGLHPNYSSGSPKPADGGCYYNVTLNDDTGGAGGVFEVAGSNTLFKYEPQKSAIKGVFSSASNSNTGSVVGYMGYGICSDSSEGTAVGVLGWGAKGTLSAYSVGLWGLGHVSLGTNEYNWSLWGAKGHGGLAKGSMFVGSTSGTYDYHPKYFYEQHTPTYFDYTDEGCLYVSATSELNDVFVKGDFTLMDTYWDDLRVPITTTRLGGSKDPTFSKVFDDGAGSQGVFTYTFSQSQEQEAYFTVQLPHTYKEGTDLHPHIHWFPTNTNAGSVVWGLEYTIASISATIGNTTIINCVDPADGTANKHQICNFPTINGSGLGISDHIICRLFRDASAITDDYTTEAGVLEFDFHHEVNTLGSREEYVK
jgi:hypothetical protein